jgi:hypothetical protein
MQSLRSKSYHDPYEFYLGVVGAMDFEDLMEMGAKGIE